MTNNEIMTLEKSLFILRHGSAEGEHKYFEAIDVIEKEINRQKAEIERLTTENADTKRDLQIVLDNSVSAKYPHCVLCGNGAILTKSLDEYDKLITDISAEAVKEFADRLCAEIDK